MNNEAETPKPKMNKLDPPERSRTYLTVVKKGDLVVDYCVARELDTDAWTF